MIQSSSRQGYILVTATMVIALIVVIMTKLFHQGYGFTVFAHATVQRMQAEQLAVGGVQLALSRLTGPTVEKGSKSEKKWGELFLSRVLPTLNRWEQYPLSEEVDGISGQVKFCITSEEGKIPLNQLYDFEKKEFLTNQDGKPVVVQFMRAVIERIVELVGKGAMNADEMLAELSDYLAQKGQPLDTISELLMLPSWRYFQRHLFYQPPSSKTEEEDERPLYLMDLFTVWPDYTTLQPWLLSDSVQALLGFGRAGSDEGEKREGLVREWLQNFKERASWEKDWDSTLAEPYNMQYKEMPPMLTQAFDPSFEPLYFSVISYGTVGRVMRGVCAIVKRTRKSPEESFFTIVRMYYL